MRRQIGCSLAAALTLVGLVVGCGRDKPAVPPPAPPEVSVANPEVREIDDILELRGLTRGQAQVDVRSRVRGFISKKHVNGGDRVTEGQLLFEIDSTSFQAAVDQATAAVAAREAERTLAEANLESVRQAQSRGAATELELKRVQANFDLATAQVAQARAVLDAAEDDLSFTKVVSPIAGRVSIDTVELGELVDPATSILCSVIDDSVIYARYTVDEAYILRLRRDGENRRPGEDGRQQIRTLLGLGNGSDYPFEGVHLRGDNTLDPNTGTVEVESIYQNPDYAIIPGMYARVRAFIGTRQSTLIPQTALLGDSMGRYVLVVDANDTAVRVPIEVVQYVEDKIAVEAPQLTPESRIIVNGLMKVRPGVKVQVTDSASPQAGGSQGSDAKGGSRAE